MTAPARKVVEEFFDRMADDGQRTTVSELFSETTVITLPATRFEGADAPEQMLRFFSGRYEWAAKEFDRWIVTDNQVISIGTLYGVDEDGDEFEDVRYVDIFTLDDGLITRLDIYNDLAAEGVV